MASRKFKDKFSFESLIKSSNHIIELCDLSYPRISSVQDINSNFLIAVYESITGQTIPDFLISDNSVTEGHNVQAVIDSLSFDVLGLSLSHITGEDVVSGNPVAISNLLEVLESIVLELFKENKKEPNDRKDDSDSSKPSSTSQSSTEESIPPQLKRKLCKKTLRKDQNPVSKRKVLESFSDVHMKRQNSKHIGDQSLLKRKCLKPVSGAVKRAHTENIEELHDLNFEKKVKSLLLSNKPNLHTYQMKKLYFQSLKTPLKRKSIPICTKSFLLPFDLRPKIPNEKTVKKSKSSITKNYLQPGVSRNKILKNSGSFFIQSVLDEFPGFQFPKNTQSLLTKCYYHHIRHTHKQLKDALLKKPSTLIQAEKAANEQCALSQMLEKDIKEKKILEDVKEQKFLENKIRFGLRDARLQSAKMKQYFDEFHRAMRKKLQKRNFSEEVLIERTFKEMLDIQKEKVRQLCNQVKETDEQDAKLHKQYLSALKNVYRNQLALLAEAVDTAQIDSLEQRKAQNLAVRKMNQELRKRLQRNVNSLQKDVLEIIEDIHFRELDAQNFISSFQQLDS